MSNRNGIYKRKDNRYECRIFLGKNDDGKPKYKSFYGKTAGEAEEKRNLFVSKISCVPQDQEKTAGMRFSAIAEEWLSSKNMDINQSTYANYRMKLDVHILPSFGDMTVSDISAKMVYDFMNEKKSAGKSSRYVTDILVVLKAIFKYAAKTYGVKKRI